MVLDEFFVFLTPHFVFILSDKVEPSPNLFFVFFFSFFPVHVPL